MIEKKIHVASSLEARPAALFVQTASKFTSSIHIKLEDKIVNAKSIMGIISLGILDGHDITISANGDDEIRAVETLEKFLNGD